MITNRKVLRKRISPIVFLVVIVMVFAITYLWFNSHNTFDKSEVVITNFNMVDDLTSTFYDEDNEIDKITDVNPEQGNVINMNLYFYIREILDINYGPHNIINKYFTGNFENPNNKITILFWNGFWKWPFYGMGEGNTGFISHHCKYTNCYTTNQRTELFQQNKKIDAVIVHGWNRDLDQELKAVSQSIVNINS